VLVLISDANILLDMELGDLLASMFSLDCQFMVPDVLYADELEAQHAHLLDMGLKTMSLSARGVAMVQALSRVYSKPSRIDLFTIALAEEQKCSLLTGDAALRQAAESEQIDVKGTIWLIEKLVLEGKITVAIARASLGRMRDSGRRLPWDIAEQRLSALE
jgi:hypothetical protein